MNKQDFINRNTDLIEYIVASWNQLNGFSFVNSSKLKNRKSNAKSVSYLSLRDAFNDYQWAEEDFEIVTSKLLRLGNKLRRNINKNDTKKLYMTVCEVLYWGGVLKDNIAGPFLQKALDKTLVEYLQESVAILDCESFTEDMIDELPSKLLSDSGATKVYSLLAKECIIYDDRVSASLGVLICEFWSEKPLSEDLSLIVSGTKSRNPSNAVQKFPRKGSTAEKKTAHFISNIKVNWLLSTVAERLLSSNHDFKASVKEVCDRQNIDDVKWVAIRVLEASLFMAGHKVT